MGKTFDRAAYTPEQIEELEEKLKDPEVVARIEAAYQDALGPTSVVMDYIQGRIENEVAYRQRRASLVPTDELARLTAIAFTGLAAEACQGAIDVEIGHTVGDFFGIPRYGSAEVEQRAAKRQQKLLVRMLGNETATTWQDYIRRRVTRVAEYGEKEKRSALSSDDRVPMVYMGKWRDDAVYARGETATRNGLMWHCNNDGTTDVPGTGPSWTMTSKSHDRYCRPREAE